MRALCAIEQPINAPCAVLLVMCIDHMEKAERSSAGAAVFLCDAQPREDLRGRRVR